MRGFQFEDGAQNTLVADNAELKFDGSSPANKRRRLTRKSGRASSESPLTPTRNIHNEPSNADEEAIWVPGRGGDK